MIKAINSINRFLDQIQEKILKEVFAETHQNIKNMSSYVLSIVKQQKESFSSVEFLIKIINIFVSAYDTKLKSLSISLLTKLCFPV